MSKTAADEDQRKLGEDERIIRKAREQAALAVRTYNRARRAGVVDPSVQATLADAALDFYDALHPYRDEDALSTEWDERGIEWVEETADEAVTVEEDLDRWNGNSRAVQRRKIMTVAPSRLRDAIRELNDIAKELGFSREAKSGTHRAEIDDDLMEAYKQWRQEHEN